MERPKPHPQGYLPIAKAELVADDIRTVCSPGKVPVEMEQFIAMALDAPWTEVLAKRGTWSAYQRGHSDGAKCSPLRPVPAIGYDQWRHEFLTVNGEPTEHVDDIVKLAREIEAKRGWAPVTLAEQRMAQAILDGVRARTPRARFLVLPVCQTDVEACYFVMERAIEKWSYDNLGRKIDLPSMMLSLHHDLEETVYRDTHPPPDRAGEYPEIQLRIDGNHIVIAWSIGDTRVNFVVDCR